MTFSIAFFYFLIRSFQINMGFIQEFRYQNKLIIATMIISDFSPLYKATTTFNIQIHLILLVCIVLFRKQCYKLSWIVINSYHNEYLTLNPLILHHYMGINKCDPCSTMFHIYHNISETLYSYNAP